MAPGILYTYPENFRAYKVLVAAKYAGTEIKIAPDFVFGETNKTESFLKKFPSGKVPAYETPDGTFLTESNAIAYYVANDDLRGALLLQKAQIIHWLSFADSEILPASCAWVYPVLGIMNFNKQNFDRAIEDTKSNLSLLDKHLLYRTYLVGEQVSLADIVVACTLLHLYTYTLDPKFREPFVNVNRWFTTIVNQPEFKAVVGEVKLCDKVAVIDHKKIAQLNQNQKQQQSKGKDKKKDEKKEEKKEKEKKTASAAAPEEQLDETELALAAEPKSKDPFDSLPKGTFNFDDFKRFYSNEDEAKSVPYFWEKFDPDNYSIWFGEYKYPDELTKVFMSCNLITGMFQRLDKMRKQAFASVCLFGEDNNSSISGIWVWRGQELAFKLSPDWQIDYESYDWKKLDPKEESTKILVQNYFSWTGTDKQGRKFNQGKIFK